MAIINDSFGMFKEETGYDIKSFFEDFVLFCNSYYPLIVMHYYGKENINIEDSFGRLDNLLDQSKKIEPLFNLKSNSLVTILAWELLDLFTECQTKLWTIDRSSRWLRSAIIGRYASNIAVQRLLKTRENFEAVVTQLGSDNFDDDWVGVALKNQIEEESYTPDGGGGMFKINIRSGGNFDIPNIVSNLDSKEILGKDIDVNFRFVNNDLATVEYENAVMQALNTILNSLKGSIPEFPDYGIPNDSIGSSVNAIQYPTLFKHLINMFQRDARWVEVNLLDVYRKDDNIFMKISAKTVTNNYLITNIQL